MNNQEILKKWYEDMGKISGEWNGDEPGLKEDRAGSADEAQGLIDRLSDIFGYLEY